MSDTTTKMPLWIVHVEDSEHVWKHREYRVRAESRRAAEVDLTQRKDLDPYRFDVWASWKCDCGC